MDFGAPWCGPCQSFTKIFEQLASEFLDVCFAQVNVEQFPHLAETFHIHSIPHLIVFKQGIAIYSESGNMPASILKELLVQARNADVSALLESIRDEHKD